MVKNRRREEKERKPDRTLRGGKTKLMGEKKRLGQRNNHKASFSEISGAKLLA